MDLYQDCSYDAPGVKTGPPGGGGGGVVVGVGGGWGWWFVTRLKHGDKERKLQNFSSLKLEGVEL